MENPKCPYCDNEMTAKDEYISMWETRFYYECSCGARSPYEHTPDAALAAGVKPVCSNCGADMRMRKEENDERV